MPEYAAASPLTRHPSFMLFWCARTFTNGAYMMQGVAVGWQIYELTNDPFDLGLVGLAQFVPVVGFSIIIGQVADLFDRRLAHDPPPLKWSRFEVRPAGRSAGFTLAVTLRRGPGGSKMP